jgi:hypothetical protein
VLLMLPLLAVAGTVTTTVTFDSRMLSFFRANGFDMVQLAGQPSSGLPGEPVLPEVVCNVVVPAGASVVDVAVTRSLPEAMPGSYQIHPAQTPVTLSSRTQPAFVPPDPAVYQSSQPWPSQPVSWDGYTGTKSGYRLTGFALHPLSYVPATGVLTLWRSLTVTVTYREADVVPGRFTRRQVDLLGAEVRRIVLNQDDVARFAPPVRERDNMDCDYAIITSTALAGNWSTLADWRTKKGWFTRVFSVDTIVAHYAGRDRQEKIRNFIIDYWENHGLVYVLLAGDNSIVPGRRGRVTVSGSTGNIPADVYYGDLQWSWDSDHDSIFGEMTDTVDLYYDVMLGRASVDNAAQVTTFINKTLLYENTPTTDYLRKMLLPYVNLFPDNNYSGRVISDSIANHTPAGWTDTYIGDPSGTSQIRDAINQGYNYVHGAAHGDDYGWYTYYGTTIYSTSVAGGQTNSTRPCVVNSMACISGNFEAEDCLAEVMMNNPNGGAVAAIMNSREGWGTPPAMGPSELLDFKFYKFLLDEDSSTVGGTHAHSKDFYAYSARSQDVWRWCYYDLNLFGDPDMQLWDSTPTAFTVTNADSIHTGAQSFQVTVTRNGNPVYNALVSCYKPGELHVTSHTAWNGVATLTISPTSAGTMYLTVSGHGSVANEKTVVVRTGTPQPFVVIQGYTVEDGGNGQLDPGEAADVYVTLRNLGNAAATGVQGLLRTASSYITVSDSNAAYGTLNPDDTARGDAYHVTASAGTPPGAQVEFTVHVVSSEGSWDPTFTLTIGVPPTPGRVYMDHDTGYCKLTVTAVGSIGFTEPPARDLGSGFCYPKAGLSSLYFSSFMLGNSPTYLVDRFYGQPASTAPPNSDFAIVESLRTILPPVAGDEQFRCVMSDAGHAAPRSIRVTMNSYQNAAAGYDDFVVMVYAVSNRGASPVTGLYAGIISDFDVGTASDTNTVTSNEIKRYIFMRHASVANPCVGLKLLAPTSFANLTAVDHDRYVYPDSAVSDGMKYRILNGTISQRNSNRAYDWSAAVSAGPFDLDPGETYYCAFAVLGGVSAADFDVNADSAQSWFDRSIGIEDNSGPSLDREGLRVRCVPNPFQRSLTLCFNVPVAGRVSATVFDITGREVARLLDNELPAGQVQARWNPGTASEGVYVLKVTEPAGTTTEKLILLR